MKLTKVSKSLMSFFIKNKCINHSTMTKKTMQILRYLYREIKRADTFIQNKKKEGGPAFYKLKVTKLSVAHEIPKPQQFNADSFPSEVREHIDKTTTYDLQYTFSLYDREIVIHFLVEEKHPELMLSLYNSYVDKILVWLFIANEFSSKSCSKKLTIFIYMTSLQKHLPESNINVLDRMNVNTAFTYTCLPTSEIVVFRYEEWFKVLIHESFHNLGLDFSGMNIDRCVKRILSIFNVESDVLLYEAYTEFWAETINSMFCSFYLSSNKDNEEEFITNFDFFINLERTYSFFQLVKSLNFMGLQYADLYSNSQDAEILRKTMYKEKSNVLCYYIIRAILMNNYQGFLSWCNENNTSLLNFKKTNTNLDNFCKFIERNYKSTSMLEGVGCMENILSKIKNTKTKTKTKKYSKNVDLLLKNMRMSIGEMG
jgi:hypothetical protein